MQPCVHTPPKRQHHTAERRHASRGSTGNNISRDKEEIVRDFGKDKLISEILAYTTNVEKSLVIQPLQPPAYTTIVEKSF